MFRTLHLFLLGIFSVTLLCQCEDKGVAVKIKGLRDEIDELSHLNAKVESDRRRIESQIETIKADKQKLEAEKARLETERESANKRLEEIKAEFERYKAQYKLSMKKRAPGLKIEDFASADGKTYADVVLKEITDTGIHFGHRDGTMRLETKQLPEKLQTLLGLLIDAPVNAGTSAVAATPRQINLRRSADRDVTIKAAEAKAADLRKQRSKALSAAQDTRIAIDNATKENQPTADLRRILREQEQAATQLQAQILQAEVEVHTIRNTPLEKVPEK